MAARGRMTFGDAAAIYKRRLEDSQHLKPRAKEYRRETINALLKTWPGLENTDVIYGSDCDFANGKIAIKGDPETGTKNWEVRMIPMIPDMRRLLEPQALLDELRERVGVEIIDRLRTKISAGQH